MKCALKFAAVLLVLLNLAGCASSGGVMNESPIATGKPVSLANVLVETSSSAGVSEAERGSLNDSIITGLKETGLFGSVGGTKLDANSGGGIRIGVEIKEIQRVSDRARVWMGALAGRARITIRVTVTDLIAGNQIETFEVEGESGKSATAGTTAEAMQPAAESVVVQMAKISSLTSE